MLDWRGVCGCRRRGAKYESDLMNPESSTLSFSRCAFEFRRTFSRGPREKAWATLAGGESEYATREDPVVVSDTSLR